MKMRQSRRAATSPMRRRIITTWVSRTSEVLPPCPPGVPVDLGSCRGVDWRSVVWRWQGRGCVPPCQRRLSLAKWGRLPKPWLCQSLRLPEPTTLPISHVRAGSCHRLPRRDKSSATAQPRQTRTEGPLASSHGRGRPAQLLAPAGATTARSCPVGRRPRRPGAVVGTLARAVPARHTAG